MVDDEKARAERAASLRREIDELAKGKPRKQPPRNPNEFVEEKMREKAREEREAGESPDGD
jgi:hypothetical protein